jgi:hypothetical protein
MLLRFFTEAKRYPIQFLVVAAAQGVLDFDADVAAKGEVCVIGCERFVCGLPPALELTPTKASSPVGPVGKQSKLFRGSGGAVTCSGPSAQSPGATRLVGR